MKHAPVELLFATNHLGHFVLALSQHGALAEGAAERGDARIVALSPAGHRYSMTRRPRTTPTCQGKALDPETAEKLWEVSRDLLRKPA